MEFFRQVGQWVLDFVQPLAVDPVMALGAAIVGLVLLWALS